MCWTTTGDFTSKEKDTGMLHKQGCCLPCSPCTSGTWGRARHAVGTAWYLWKESVNEWISKWINCRLSGGAFDVIPGRRRRNTEPTLLAISFYLTCHKKTYVSCIQEAKMDPPPSSHLHNSYWFRWLAQVLGPSNDRHILRCPGKCSLTLFPRFKELQLCGLRHCFLLGGFLQL